MSTWEDFTREAPEMAAAGRALWREHVLMYLASVRADGSPRLHPVVPVLAAGRVFLAIPEWSPKWRDLDTEPRCVLHGLPGPRDDEFLLRCRARPAPEAIDAVCAAAGHTIHDSDRVFELDIEQVDHGWWENIGQPTTYPVRQRWTPGGGSYPLKRG